MRIVAIGGGDMTGGETAALDRRIVELTGKERPRALFLPTASFDARDYAEAFAAVYGALGCEVEALYLWDGYEGEEIQAKIQETKWNSYPHVWEFRGDVGAAQRAIGEADLIYVGGGNTRRMIELWRSCGVDQMLAAARDRDVVLSGLSAGCICWGRYGNSDAALTEDLGRWTMCVDCLDHIPLALCPHMSREGFRLEEFKAMMAETPGVGVGLDDGAALEVIDGQYRILSCIEGAGGHRLAGGRHEVLSPMTEFGSLDDLVSG